MKNKKLNGVKNKSLFCEKTYLERVREAFEDRGMMGRLYKFLSKKKRGKKE